MPTTLAALFPNRPVADAAVASVLDAGVHRDDVSVVSYGGGVHDVDEPTHTPPSTAAAAAGAGGAAGSALAALGLAAVPGVGWLFAAGPVGALLTAAAVGGAAGAVGGGLASALAEHGIARRHATLYAEAVRRGASLVVVQVDERHEHAASAALLRHRPIDVESPAASWDPAEGPEAPEPMSPREVEAERERLDTHRLQFGAPPPVGANPYVQVYGHPHAQSR